MRQIAVTKVRPRTHLGSLENCRPCFVAHDGLGVVENFRRIRLTGFASFYELGRNIVRAVKFLIAHDRAVIANQLAGETDKFHWE